jgi:uncharacterized lipoprotein YddW (UPF0748 family)
MAWIPYWDTWSQSQIDQNINLALAMNINTIVFEVYGHGMALYDSSIVPKFCVTAYSCVPAGFDPLAYAITRCHAQGLKIFAWFIPYYSGLWSNLATPGYYPEGQVLLKHPDWITKNKDGGNWTETNEIWLDPGIPALKDYLTSVMQEVCTYNIDGVMLDYIRYDEASQGYNPLAIAQFKAQYGYTPTDDWDTVWMQWRRDQVTDLVSRFKSIVNSANPNRWFGAAIWGNHNVGFTDKLQDNLVWLARGYYDCVAVMGYTTNNTTFTTNNQFYLNNAHSTYILPGISPEQWTANPAGMAGQMQLARNIGAKGMHLFCLSEFQGQQALVNAAKGVFSGPAPTLPKANSNLVADFSTSPLSGVVGSTSFVSSDGTTGGSPPYNYEWQFGDNATSTSQNPIHTYGSAGNYTITLTVTDSMSNKSTVVKSDYIRVYNRGDANGDGSINSVDMTKVKREILGLDEQTPGADANGDGKVDAVDITRIELIIIGQ